MVDIVAWAQLMVGTNTKAAITAIHKIFPFFMFPPLIINNYERYILHFAGFFSPYTPSLKAILT